MKREAPVANKKDFGVQDTIRFRKHLAQLAKVKACLNVHAPTGGEHLLQRSKKQSMKEDRFMEIQRDNGYLLKKMRWINTQPPSILQNHKYDDGKIQVRSLNAQGRKKELQRIMFENSKMLIRITHQKSTYDRNEFQEHAQRHHNYLKSMAGSNVRPIRNSTAPLPPLLTALNTSKVHSKSSNQVSILLQTTKFMNGRKVDVSVVEVSYPKHNFILQAFDQELSESAEICIPFRIITQLWSFKSVAAGLFRPQHRSQLAALLADQLDMDGSQLIFKKPETNFTVAGLLQGPNSPSSST